jgi:hypothetical protein
MINQTIERVLRASSWLDPGRLIDRFLDEIENLRRFVLPAEVDNPFDRKTQVEARLGQFGA